MKTIQQIKTLVDRYGGSIKLEECSVSAATSITNRLDVVVEVSTFDGFRIHGYEDKARTSPYTLMDSEIDELPEEDLQRILTAVMNAISLQQLPIQVTEKEMKGSTYRQLLTQLQTLTEEQLDCNLSVWDVDCDEYFPAIFMICNPDGVLDDDHPVFACNFEAKE